MPKELKEEDAGKLYDYLIERCPEIIHMPTEQLIAHLTSEELEQEEPKCQI